jgi:hypothetical protein
LVGSGLKFAALFGVVAWSFLGLPVAAKNKMYSVVNFLKLKKSFTAIQFIITGLLIALVYRS